MKVERALRLKGGSAVPVSCFWYQRARDSESVTGALNASWMRAHD